jgi:hypothetical protein
VSHEYPPNRALDSVGISRVFALRDYGLTQRQREFLVTAMVHSGCFLERQYCEFTGTVRGDNSRALAGERRRQYNIVVARPACPSLDNISTEFLVRFHFYVGEEMKCALVVFVWRRGWDSNPTSSLLNQ